MDPPVGWFAPQPLWRAIPRERLAAWHQRPFILRFTRDDFMAQVQETLASAQPEGLARFVARPESWRDREGDLAAESFEQAEEGAGLKLYQPAHGRFYLVAGALACRLPGLPDRAVDTAGGESAFFVLRRLVEDGEYGWSTGEPPAGQGHCGHYQDSPGRGWRRLADPAVTLLRDEERFPLFPLTAQAAGARRRVFAGVVPVTSKETLPTPPPTADQSKQPGGDPRPILFGQQVVGPLIQLRALFAGPGKAAAVVSRQVEHALAYALLDLTRAIRDDLPPALFADIMDAQLADLRPNLAHYGPAQDLAGLIRGRSLGANNTKLKALLRALQNSEDKLRQEFGPDDALSSLPELGGWQLADPNAPLLNAWVADQPEGSPLLAAYAKALQPYDPANAPGALATYPDQPKLDPSGGVRYILRLVYERPQCCLPVLSAPTREFAIASFFDPDAPTRPLTITLPLDTSTEGLRRHGKGVTFVLSDQLRRQMDRVKGMQELLDQDLRDEGGLQLGLVCSFSIPIITICALILLLIMVNLLNIIFWWLPFFKLCLPVPRAAR